MKKRILTIIATLGFLCVMIFIRQTSPETVLDSSKPISTRPNTIENLVRNEDGSFRLVGTYEDLLTLNEELYCTYTQNSIHDELTGTYYLKNAENHLDQIRIKQATNVTWFNISLLLKDSRLYNWGDVQPKGMGVVQDFETNRPENSTKISTLIYDCIPQIIDPKIFELPPDITFRERYDVTPLVTSSKL